MKTINLTANDCLIIMALLEQAIEDEKCYTKEELDEFKELYKKMKGDEII